MSALARVSVLACAGLCIAACDPDRPGVDASLGPMDAGPMDVQDAARPDAAARDAGAPVDAGPPPMVGPIRARLRGCTVGPRRGPYGSSAEPFALAPIAGTSGFALGHGGRLGTLDLGLEALTEVAAPGSAVAVATHGTRLLVVAETAERVRVAWVETDTAPWTWSAWEEVCSECTSVTVRARPVLTGDATAVTYSTGSAWLWSRRAGSGAPLRYEMWRGHTPELAALAGGGYAVLYSDSVTPGSMLQIFDEFGGPGAAHHLTEWAHFGGSTVHGHGDEAWVFNPSLDALAEVLVRVRDAERLGTHTLDAPDFSYETADVAESRGVVMVAYERASTIDLLALRADTMETFMSPARIVEAEEAARAGSMVAIAPHPEGFAVVYRARDGASDDLFGHVVTCQSVGSVPPDPGTDPVTLSAGATGSTVTLGIALRGDGLGPPIDRLRVSIPDAGVELEAPLSDPWLRVEEAVVLATIADLPPLADRLVHVSLWSGATMHSQGTTTLDNRLDATADVYASRQCAGVVCGDPEQDRCLPGLCACDLATEVCCSSADCPPPPSDRSCIYVCEARQCEERCS